MQQDKFPELPDGFKRVLVYHGNHVCTMVATNGDFVTFFVWDYCSLSWNEDRTYRKLDELL